MREDSLTWQAQCQHCGWTDPDYRVDEATSRAHARAHLQTCAAFQASSTASAPVPPSTASIDPPDFAAYYAALQRHGTHPVVLETQVLDLTMLVSALQLALRHPDFPPTLRAYVDGFVFAAIDRLDRLDPVLGATMRAGNDVQWDT